MQLNFWWQIQNPQLTGRGLAVIQCRKRNWGWQEERKRRDKNIWLPPFFGWTDRCVPLAVWKHGRKKKGGKIQNMLPFLCSLSVREDATLYVSFNSVIVKLRPFNWGFQFCFKMFIIDASNVMSARWHWKSQRYMQLFEGNFRTHYWKDKVWSSSSQKF